VCEFTNLGSSSIKKDLARQKAVSIFLHERGSNLGVVFITLVEGLRQYLGMTSVGQKINLQVILIYFGLFIFSYRNNGLGLIVLLSHCFPTLSSLQLAAFIS